jgi:acetyltransferase
LSTGDNAYQALFAQAGIIRANSISELFDLAQAFSLNQLQQVRTVAILTNAGGPGVLTTDAVIESNLQLADLEPSTVERLHQFLPAAASTHNPVDVLGDAGSALYKQAIDVLVEDQNTDALIVLLTPQSMTEVSQTAQAIVEVRAKSNKPIVVSFMGRDLVKAGVELLRSKGIAVTAFPEPAARALAAIGQFASFSQQENQTPRLSQDVDKEKVAAIFAKAKEQGQTSFPEAEAMEIMRAYNFPILRSQVVTSAEEAEQIAKEFNCQLVMKIVSPDILHKSDVGGVKLNIGADQAKQAYQDMMTTVAAKLPQADLQGVLLMEMATPGVELALGVNKTDLGTVIMLGLGGVYIEILKDVNFAFAPLVREDIVRMIKSLRSYKLLEGARGSAAVDQESLIESVERLSQLVIDFPEITELDINPLLINARGAKVLDVRIVIK